MPVQVEGNTINKSQEVSRRPGMCQSIAISQTKVSFSQSATGKLILMTMIGTLISRALVRCVLSPYFNISPFRCFWCLTEWKASQYFCYLTKGTHRRSKTRPHKCDSQHVSCIKIYDETAFSSYCVPMRLYERRKEEINEWQCRWNLIFDGKPSGV